MKSFPLSALAILALVAAADARPREESGREAPSRANPRAEAALAPLRQAATDCFAETVMANPGAMTHARAGRWFQAAGVIGFLCRPEVDAMVRVHDRYYGPGTGARYFAGPYTHHLDGQLAARLQPVLERKAVASAEAPMERASAGDPNEE